MAGGDATCHELFNLGVDVGCLLAEPSEGLQHITIHSALQGGELASKVCHFIGACGIQPCV
jgi:hypothetical protein